MQLTCPSEEEFAALIEGRLGLGARTHVFGHVESCDSCEALLLELLHFDVSMLAVSRQGSRESVSAWLSRFR
jgi:hypothetical protein